MRKTLENFYYGNITPNTQDMAPSSELKRAADRVARCENQLLGQLDKARQMVLAKLIESQHEIDSITALGAVKLEALNTHTIQGFYNKLVKPPEEGGKGLSPKTLQNTHSVLHRALQQAVSIGYIRSNPTDACILPRMEKKEIKPLDETQTKAFLAAIKGHPLETLFTVTLFTELRKGEALGLRWDCVDFKRGTILIDKQLQREKKKGSAYVFVPLKNDKSRTVTPAPWVMQLLKHHRAVQAEQRLKLDPMWEDSGLVFTTETGRHLDIHTIQRAFKPIVSSIGCPKVRFHDLRHPNVKPKTKSF